MEIKNIKNDLIGKNLYTQEKQKYLFSIYRQNRIPNDITTPVTELLKVICYSVDNDELALINIKFKSLDKNNFPERFYKLINVYNKLYIIGGENSLGEELDCTWKLEMALDKDIIVMNALNIAKMKEKRISHNAIYIPKYKKILICGGNKKISSEYLNINIKENEEKDWDNANRFLHNPIKEGSLFIVNDTKLFLIGGFNSNLNIYNQKCEILDLKALFEINDKNEKSIFWEEIELENNTNKFMKSYMGIINNIYKDKITIFGGDIIYHKNKESEYFDIHKLKNITYDINKNKIIINTQKIKGLDRLSHLLFSDCQTFIDLYGKDYKNVHFKAAFTNQNKLVKFNCNMGGFSFKHLKINTF